MVTHGTPKFGRFAHTWGRECESGFFLSNKLQFGLCTRLFAAWRKLEGTGSDSAGGILGVCGALKITGLSTHGRRASCQVGKSKAKDGPVREPKVWEKRTPTVIFTTKKPTSMLLSTFLFLLLVCTTESSIITSDLKLNVLVNTSTMPAFNRGYEYDNQIHCFSDKSCVVLFTTHPNFTSYYDNYGPEPTAGGTTQDLYLVHTDDFSTNKWSEPYKLHTQLQLWNVMYHAQMGARLDCVENALENKMCHILYETQRFQARMAKSVDGGKTWLLSSFTGQDNLGLDHMLGRVGFGCSFHAPDSEIFSCVYVQGGGSTGSIRKSTNGNFSTYKDQDITFNSYNSPPSSTVVPSIGANATVGYVSPADPGIGASTSLHCEQTKQTCLLAYGKRFNYDSTPHLNYGALLYTTITSDGGETWRREVGLTWSEPIIQHKIQYGNQSRPAQVSTEITCSQNECILISSTLAEGIATVDKPRPPSLDISLEMVKGYKKKEGAGEKIEWVGGLTGLFPALSNRLDGGLPQISCDGNGLCLHGHVGKDGSLYWQASNDAGESFFTPSYHRQELPGRKAVSDITCIDGVGCIALITQRMKNMASLYVTELVASPTAAPTTSPTAAPTTSPSAVPILQERTELIEASMLVRTTSLSLFAACLFASCACALFLVFARRHPVLRAAQPPFLGLIVLGSAISSMSVFFFSQNSFVSPDFGCMAGIWTFGVGFVLMYGALLVKMNRIRFLFNLQTYLKPSDRSRLSNHRNFALVGIIILVECAILLAWQLTNPLTFNYKPVIDPYTKQVKFQQAVCSSQYDIEFAAGLGAYHLVVLIYSAWLANKTSKLHIAYSEGKHIRFSVLNGLQFSVIAIPILYLNTDVSISMLLRSGVIALHDLSLLFLVFGPKIWMVYFGLDENENSGKDILQRQLESKKHSAASSNSSTSTTVQVAEEYSFQVDNPSFNSINR